MADPAGITVVRQKKMVGCVTLVGELYNQTVLTERIIHECIEALLEHMVVRTQKSITRQGPENDVLTVSGSLFWGGVGDAGQDHSSR